MIPKKICPATDSNLDPSLSVPYSQVKIAYSSIIQNSWPDTRYGLDPNVSAGNFLNTILASPNKSVGAAAAAVVDQRSVAAVGVDYAS